MTKLSGGVITIIPKLPSADDVYTPEQRRIIDAHLDKEPLVTVENRHPLTPSFARETGDFAVRYCSQQS